MPYSLTSQTSKPKLNEDPVFLNSSYRNRINRMHTSLLVFFHRRVPAVYDGYRQLTLGCDVYHATIHH